MNEIQLKYGCNPNQKPSRIFLEDGSGGEDLDRLFQGVAGEPELLLWIHRVVKERLDAVLPQK